MRRAISLYFLVRFINGAFALAFIGVFTRLLSIESYGYYSVMIAYATMLSSIVFQWQNVVVSRLYIANKTCEEQFLRATNTGFLASSLVALTIALLYALFSPWQKFDFISLMLATALSIVSGRHGLHLQLANITGAVWRYAILHWIRCAISFIGGLLFFLIGINPHGLLVAQLISMIIGILFVSPFSRRKMPWRVGSVEKSVEIFKIGYPLAINTVFILFVDIADRIMLGSMLGLESAGKYSAPYDFIQSTIGALLNVCFLAYYPDIVARYEANAFNGAIKRLHDLFVCLFLLGGFLLVNIYYFSDEIMGFLFAAKYYGESGTLLPLIAIGIFIGSIKTYYLDSVFHLAKSPKHLVYSSLLMAMMNVVLNLVLIPKFGIKGSAIATLASFLLGLCVSFILGRRFVLIGLPAKSTLKVLYGLVLLFIVYSGLELTAMIWIARFLIGNAFFGLLCYLFDVLNCRSFVDQIFYTLKCRFLLFGCPRG